MKCQTDHYHIVSSHPKMNEIFQLVDKVAPTDSTVIIYGESGTGKELIARALHFNGKKLKKPFITVNCGPSLKSFWKVNFSGMKKVLSPVLSVHESDVLSKRTKELFSWMK